MFIEYRGQVHVFEDYVDIESAWLIVKHSHVPNVRQLVALVKAASLYGCSYMQHETAMATIRPLVIGK